MTLKHRIGRVLLPRLPLNRRTFNLFRFEVNATITSAASRLSPRLLARRSKLARQRHLRVNLGSGGTGTDGWINIDIGRSHADQTLPWDIRRGLPFSDDSVAMMRAEHVIEHIEFREDLPRLLSEVHRVLEPGGVIRIVVPDAERWIAAYASGDPEAWASLGMPTLPEDMPTPMAMLNHIFHQDGEHYFAYDFVTMRFVLQRAGFGCVRRTSFGCSNRQELKQDQKHHEPYSLYVEAEK